MDYNKSWSKMSHAGGSHDDVDLLSNFLQAWWMFYVKILAALILSLFGGYGLVGLMRDRCKKSEVVWKLTLIVFSAPVFVFVFFSLCAEFHICDRFIADTVSFGSVAGMLLKLVTKPQGEKVIKLIVQEVNGKQNDVWINSSKLSVAEVRDKIAETLEITPSTRVSIESGKGRPIEDLSVPFFDHVDEAHQSTDFFGFCTATCYISIAEVVPEEAAPDIEWKVKEGDKRFNPFKLLLDSRIKYGDPFMIIGRSATSNDAKKFHISAVDRFAGAAPGNAPLFVQLKIYAWSSTSSGDETVAGEDSKTDNGNGNRDGNASVSGNKSVNGHAHDWENGSEMASSVNTTGTRRSRSIVGMLFRRKVSDEGRMRGKPIHHGDQVVIEADGR